MIWLLPYPPPPSRQQVGSLSQSSCVSPVELTDDKREGEGAGGGRGGGGAKLYDGEKGWSSIKH